MIKILDLGHWLRSNSPPLDENQQFLTTGSNKNRLFYGDNLEILRRFIPNDSVDLIYLDPPFNSKADYNILFKEPTGEKSIAQIQAFSDFWKWDEAARKSYDYLTSNEVDHKIASLAEAMYRLLGKNDMTAYLFMMTTRLIELHRVLRPRGSLYLHCDPTASHYLKLALDAIFDARNFRNEIIWHYSGWNKKMKDHFNKRHDIILYYSKSDNPFFNSYADKWRSKEEYVKLRKQKILIDKDGREYVKSDAGDGKRVKRYLSEAMQYGKPVDDVWDLDKINNSAKESLGYPTQKPVELLKRIISASCNKGAWILDPFCGCGTAIAAAEELDMHWIGIDITWLAINVVKNRMKASFPYSEFDLKGEPKDIGAAKELAKDRYQFQYWALSLIHARPVGSKPDNPREGKKGADEGVDGWLVFRIDEKLESIVVQVKSGHVSVKDIRELRDVVSRQKAALGIFITLEQPTSEMIKEVKATDPYVAKSLNMEFPKIQILTIEELLEDKKPNIPQTASAYPEAILTKRVSSKSTSTLDAYARK